MPEGFNSDVIPCCGISKKLTSWTEKAPICKGTVKKVRVRYLALGLGLVLGLRVRVRVGV